MDNHLQLYKNRPDLTIKSQAEHYVDSKKGLGPTHVKAYREGAKFLARLLSILVVLEPGCPVELSNTPCSISLLNKFFPTTLILWLPVTTLIFCG